MHVKKCQNCTSLLILALKFVYSLIFHGNCTLEPYIVGDAGCKRPKCCDYDISMIMSTKENHFK